MGSVGLKHHVLGSCELKEGHHWLKGSKSDVVRDMGSIEHYCLDKGDFGPITRTLGK